MTHSYALASKGYLLWWAPNGRQAERNKYIMFWYDYFAMNMSALFNFNDASMLTNVIVFYLVQNKSATGYTISVYAETQNWRCDMWN